MRKYTKDHEWILLEGDTATIGITDYAKEQLGELVFVELPKIGSDLAQGAPAVVVESVKAASEIYAPVAGRVVAVNEALLAEPDLVGADPMSKGWFFKLKVQDPSQLEGLMDESAYRATLP